jgi:hypothetical protein
MAVSCDSKNVSVPEPGKLRLFSAWTSNRSGGEFARFEVRLSVEGQFRFVVNDVATTTVKAARRKVGAKTQVEILTPYVNLVPGPDDRLVRFEICAITKSASGTETEVISRIAKFLS